MPADLSVQLPWQGLAAGANIMQGLGGDPQQAMAQLGANYGNAYQGALNLNAGLYSGIQTGYENLRNQLDKQYGDIAGGYQKLYGDVLGHISGTNATNLRDIDTSYAAQQGKAVQDAMNRGLGNSTVLMNMQRGINMDRSRARTASENAFAQLGANYMSQIGQGGLQAQMRGADQATQLGQNQLNWLNTVQAPYPNAGMYQDLAKMYGAQAQGAQDRQAIQQLQQPSGLLPRTGGIGGVASGSAGSMFHWGPSMGTGGGYSGGGGGFYGGFGGYGGGPATADPGWLAQQGGMTGGGMVGTQEMPWEGSGEGSWPYNPGEYYGGLSSSSAGNTYMNDAGQTGSYDLPYGQDIVDEWGGGDWGW